MPDREHTPRPTSRLIFTLTLAGCALLILAAGMPLASGDSGTGDGEQPPLCLGHGGARYGMGPGPGLGEAGEGHHHRHFHGPGRGEGIMALLDRLPEDLALTEQQRVDIGLVMDEAGEAMEPLVRSLDSKRETVRDAMHADPFDEFKLRAALREISDVEADLAVLRAKARVEATSHLTEEQKDFIRDRLQSRSREITGDRDRDRDRLRDRDFREQRRIQRYGSQPE